MSRSLRIPMVARDSAEPHRVSSQLELLFDLTFVIAISTLTTSFAEAVGEGRATAEIAPFLQVFFAIWLAWINFTWFASSFDSDDVSFRVLTLVQMAGVLVLAAGVPAALDGNDYAAVTVGYAIMRTALFVLWARVAVEDPASRPAALRYAIGIGVLEAGWVARQLVADTGAVSADGLLAIFVALALLELSVPAWAERRRATSWHPYHIAERYGLFAIILLGENLLSASTGVRQALTAGVSAPLLTIGLSGLLLVFVLWWLYFLQPAGDALAAKRDRAFAWGYGHYGVFASLAALGAGLKLAVEQTGQAVVASPVAIGYGVAIPVAAFLNLLWLLHLPLGGRSRAERAPLLTAGAFVLLAPLAIPAIGLSACVAAIAIACAVVAAIAVLRDRPDQGDTDARDGAVPDVAEGAARGCSPRPRGPALAGRAEDDRVAAA